MQAVDLKSNPMAVGKEWKILLKLGLPMILSMMLQSVYNIVDTVFVINMGEDGINGNLALTYAFPIQLLIVAVGVGTGIGINALLSKSLGEGNKDKANKIVSNGIFLACCIYLVFLLFGIFGARPFMTMMTNNEAVVAMGKDYLTICCTCSFGVVCFNVFERFLQATGRTLFSMIAQVVGAVTNIILDYVFIYPCGWGIQGAAWATVIGQVVCMILALTFHYKLDKEIDAKLKDVRPQGNIIKMVYKIGLPAAIMQGLLAVMMFLVNIILGTATGSTANGDVVNELLTGSYGIYYKIQQLALFASFGLSNTIITVLSFNYGMQNKKRVKNIIKFGVLYSLGICLILTALFQIFATPLSNLFGLASTDGSESVKQTCVVALHIATIGYVFMGFSVAVQGVLQAFGRALTPLIISLLRLIIFVMPFVFIFVHFCSADAVVTYVWWTFPIAEFLTAIVSVFILIHEYRTTVKPIKE